MATHIHIHKGKTKDTPSEVAKLKQAKQLIEQAKRLLGGPADEAEDGNIRKAANNAFDACFDAIKALSAY